MICHNLELASALYSHRKAHKQTLQRRCRWTADLCDSYVFGF